MNEHMKHTNDKIEQRQYCPLNACMDLIFERLFEFLARFKPAGGCVIDNDVAFAVSVPRFDASVQVTYSSVFVLPSDTSVRIDSYCLTNGC